MNYSLKLILLNKLMIITGKVLICSKNSTNCGIDNKFNTNCQLEEVECLFGEYCFIYWSEEIYNYNNSAYVKRWKYVGCLNSSKYNNLCKLNEKKCSGNLKNNNNNDFFYINNTNNFENSTTTHVICCCNSNLCNLRAPSDKSIFERIKKDREKTDKKNSQSIKTLKDDREKKLNETRVIQELKGRKYELRKEQLHLVIGIFYTITLALSTPCLIIVCSEYYRGYPKDSKSNEENELIYGNCVWIDQYESEISDSSIDDAALPIRGLSINVPVDEVTNLNQPIEKMESVWRNEKIPARY